MASYTIANEHFAKDALRRFYAYSKKIHGSTQDTDLDLIFDIALENTDRFPGITLTVEKTPKNYIDRWVKSYYDAINNPPSRRTANPKSACTDPAIALIVRATQGMTEQQLTIGENNHNLFMSAENIQGNLLEEYIASKARPYGFLWCNGNVLHAIDFCNSDGSLLLQVKNKSNTENSSSSNIREGTTIEKWYRLGTRIRGGVRYPDFKWAALNALISEHRTEGFNLPPCDMSEREYEEFLARVASANRGLITDL